MDNMCIGTGDSPEELTKHRQIVHELLNLFKKHSYFLKLSKCVFHTCEIEFLGFKIGHGVAGIDQSKMDSLHEWPRTLSTVKEVRQVLGVLGYQRPFIKDFAALACKALGTSHLTSQNSRAHAEDKLPYTADSDHVRHTPLCAGMSQKYEHCIIK
jgi:hypothetical protein